MIVLLALLGLLVLANLVLGRLPKAPDAGGGAVATEHGDVHYLETTGAGPPVVFIHGMPSTCREFDEMRARLPESHTVAIDRPGYAWSTGDPLPFDQQLDSIVAAAKSCGIERAVLVGHSFGGMAAVGLAIRNPDFVEKMLLIAPVGGGLRLTDRTIRQARLMQLIELPVVRQLADLLFLRLLRRAASRRGALYSYGSDPRFDTKRRIAESVLAWHNSIRAFANDRLIFNDSERWMTRNLEHVTAPSLLLQGEQDISVSPKYAARLAEALPNTRLKLVPGDHQIPVNDADAAVAALRELLDQ
ncbi:MAG: alpha/beta fold hydrolase [Solirubrobacterales bacterium]